MIVSLHIHKYQYIYTYISRQDIAMTFYSKENNFPDNFLTL